MPLFFLPSWTLRWRLLNPMLYATEGSILAAIAATKLKWAVITTSREQFQLLMHATLCMFRKS